MGSVGELDFVSLAIFRGSILACAVASLSLSLFLSHASAHFGMFGCPTG